MINTYVLTFLKRHFLNPWPLKQRFYLHICSFLFMICLGATFIESFVFNMQKQISKLTQTCNQSKTKIWPVTYRIYNSQKGISQLFHITSCSCHSFSCLHWFLLHMFPTFPLIIHLQTQEKINCFLIFFPGINFLTIILNVTNTRANGSHCSHEQKGFYIVISLFQSWNFISAKDKYIQHW